MINILVDVLLNLTAGVPILGLLLVAFLLALVFIVGRFLLATASYLGNKDEQASPAARTELAESAKGCGYFFFYFIIIPLVILGFLVKFLLSLLR